MGRFVEDYHEFEHRHGGATNSVTLKSGVILFADGATARGNGLSIQMSEPPEDLHSRLKNRKTYHETKQAETQKAFEQLKAALTGFTDRAGMPLRYMWDEKNHGPAPEDGDGRDKQALLRLKEIASQHRKAVADLDREIGEIPEVKAARKRAAELARIQIEREEAARAEQAEAATVEL